MAQKARSNLVHYYASEIRQHWKRALESIFAVADLLVEAKKKLDPSDWEHLKDELPFSDSVLEKLLVIGRDKRLRRSNIYGLLPPNYSIIYEITQLDNEELRTAVMDGEISPRIHRSTFIAWRKAHRLGENDKAPSDDSHIVITSSLLNHVFAAFFVTRPVETYKTNKVFNLKEELETIICGPDRSRRQRKMIADHYIWLVWSSAFLLACCLCSLPTSAEGL
jgi:hypothetical protein